MTDSTDLPSYLSSLPYLVGYELTDAHVVAVGMSVQGVPGPTAAITWQPLPGGTDRDLAEDVAAAITRAFPTPEGEQILLVGYGPEGRQRTALLADALLGTSDRPEPHQVHIEGDTLTIRDRTTQEWSPNQRLPDVGASAVIAGNATPARSRAELMARFAPSPSPLYGDLPDQQTSQLDATPPSLQVEVATRALDHLSVPGQGNDPKQMALLSHLARGHIVVRDSVITAAADDAARADALVRTYRAAPTEQRASLASVTATVLFMRGTTRPAVEEVLRHADRDGRESRLTALVEAASDAGINPHRVRAGLKTSVENSLTTADERWSSERASTRRAASFPTPLKNVSTPSPAAQPPSSRAPSPGTEAQR